MTITDFCKKLTPSYKTVLGKTHSYVPHRVEHKIIEDEFAKEALLRYAEERFREEILGYARSYYDVGHHMDSVKAYEPSGHDKPVDEILYNEVVEMTRNCLGSISPVESISIREKGLNQVPYVESASAGFGYSPAPKGPRDGPNHVRAMNRAKAIVMNVYEAKDQEQEIWKMLQDSVPDIAFTRTQLTHLATKLKVRGVWGRPFHTILIGGLSATPVIDKLINFDTFIAIGGDPHDEVPQIIANARKKGKWILTIDWGSFDSTVKVYEINAAFDILKSVLKFPDKESETAFDISRANFIYKKIATPDGNVIEVIGGTPSGDYWTTVVNSIVNFIRIQYLVRTLTGKYLNYLKTLGDDGLGSTNIYVDILKMEELSIRHGWKLNYEKSKVTQSTEGIEFLGRTSKGGLNHRDLVKCMRLLVFPEYEVKSGDISAARATSIAQDAGGTSEILNKVARDLRRKYGIAEEEDIPRNLRMYKPPSKRVKLD